MGRAYSLREEVIESLKACKEDICRLYKISRATIYS
ncbi:hypothetical protein Cyrtocomes_01230 [Candidatus Cyrtobacter comes]|uniref:Transposase Synechocystis PCC 6803 domain-containing protein n=1 Tax=Candidatus Cyrtobacter comes TaxID=675776 RepID=A0ABU5LAE9_9RICK|nr:hypothetical protein [Candidatus Cyrtobacter comes]MDZ5762834.1 hypothetical protein [Candidatus Cyrtobacter comes]